MKLQFGWLIGFAILAGCTALPTSGEWSAAQDVQTVQQVLEQRATDIANQNNDPQKRAAMVDHLSSLTPEDSCNEIYNIAPKVLSFDLVNREAQLKLAACDYRTRDLASARARYKAMLETELDPSAIKGLALTELRDGKAEKALPLLRRANSLAQGRDATILNALGYAEDMAGNYSSAEAAFQAASNVAPDSAAAYNNLGMSKLRQKQYQDAVKFFEIALNREPTSATTRLNLRIAHAIQGDFALALAGASDEETAAVLNSVGTAKLAEEDLQSAQWLFQQALDSNPTFYESAFKNLERTRLMQQNRTP